MSARQQAKFLPDGRRLHLQDGPIDLVIQADGAPAAIDIAYDAACERFATLLDELCAELPQLRQRLTKDSVLPQGPVAARMAEAAQPYAAKHFITPMVAVAGAGAEAILNAMVGAAPLSRAYVNNGGDIALHLDDGATFEIGMVDRPDQPRLFGKLAIKSGDKIRGIATSGRHGRSFSLGIADAVTVLATNAPGADAAATMIANAVDLPNHPGIIRVPADSLQPDSDLGRHLVTRAVGTLTRTEIARALARGVRFADSLLAGGQIHAAALHLSGQTRLVHASPGLMTTIGQAKEAFTHAAS
ncbi:UPF0280 family protein [Dongia sp.]|uniref:UPF0280 family protein n=1 Tax=Dongia sp. TaxID=1977262 RepID=UPI0035B04A53